MSELERDPKASDSGCNKAMKAAMHKNVLEQSACDTATKSIEAQRRSLHSRRTREEKELRAQLQRLQDEQRLLSEFDNTDAASEAVESSEDTSSFDNDPLNFDPEQVINPYPITVRPKVSDNPTSNDRKHRSSCGSIPSPRNVRSAEYEDIDVTFPALSAAVRQSTTAFGSVSRSSVSSCAEGPYFNDPSAASAAAAGGSVNHVWLGDPEAISSVRRARKAPGRQRMDQIWARSRSLKERPTSSRLANRVTHHSDVSPLSGSPSASGACSRAGSLKETRKSPLDRSSCGVKSGPDAVADVMSQLDVKPRRAMSLKSRGSTFPVACDVMNDVVKGPSSVAPTSSSSSFSATASQESPLSLSHGSGSATTLFRASKVVAANPIGALLDAQSTPTLPPIVPGETLGSHPRHQSPQSALRRGLVCRSPSLKTIERAIGMLN